MAGILLVFIVACQSFMYFGRPQLLLQNDIATDRSFVSKHIVSYTIANKSWGHDDQGRQTITYALNFVAVDQTATAQRKLQTCQGSVALAWNWSDLDWSNSSSDDTCQNM